MYYSIVPGELSISSIKIQIYFFFTTLQSANNMLNYESRNPSKKDDRLHRLHRLHRLDRLCRLDRQNR